VEVGLPTQKRRYVFPEPDEHFFELADTLVEPWNFLKVCAPPAHFIHRIPSRWEIQPQGYMMHCSQPMIKRPFASTNDLEWKLEKIGSVHLMKCVDGEGTLAACGRLIIVEDIAVYDRIITEPQYRRQGLATLLMLELGSIALRHGATKNILVATEEGKALYEHLGWKVYSPYTSIVIPG
jgi:GNAT superfamily N-acetyltransferase